jgi:hypothetical protein
VGGIGSATARSGGFGAGGAGSTSARRGVGDVGEIAPTSSGRSRSLVASFSEALLGNGGCADGSTPGRAGEPGGELIEDVVGTFEVGRPTSLASQIHAPVMMMSATAVTVFFTAPP